MDTLLSEWLKRVYKSKFKGMREIMCKKSKKSYIVTVVLLLSLLFSPCCSSVDASSTPPASQNQIVLSTNQWKALKEELITQEQELQTLKIKLKMLGASSNEQMKIVVDLQERLKLTEQHLTSANESLTIAQSELSVSKASLTILKSQIKELEHQKKVIKRQRNLYAVLAGVLGAYGLIK